LGLILLLVGIGALTPIACCAGVIVEAFYMLHGYGIDRLHSALALLMTVALALLGPGAFSIDAKLYGRRQIVPGQD
jgi:uncharacterized membrane protein YphA (DoxX/SURF4 family)